MFMQSAAWSLAYCSGTSGVGLFTGTEHASLFVGGRVLLMLLFLLLLSSWWCLFVCFVVNFLFFCLFFSVLVIYLL